MAMLVPAARIGKFAGPVTPPSRARKPAPKARKPAKQKPVERAISPGLINR